MGTYERWVDPAIAAAQAIVDHREQCEMCNRYATCLECTELNLELMQIHIFRTASRYDTAQMN